MVFTMAYRDAERLRAARRSLRTVTLAGAPLHVQRAIAAVRLAATLVATFALWLPWHVVYPTAGWQFCWAPDCHPSAPSSTAGPSTTCTGWSHAHPIVLLVFAAFIVCALVRVRRPRIAGALGLSLVEIAALGGAFYALFDLAHMFDRVEHLRGERVFDGALAIVALTMLAEVIATPVLYLWARARLPRD